MDCLFGIQGTDFCILAADTLISRSIVAMKHDECKYRPLNPSSGVVFMGESGDTHSLVDYLQANVALYGIRNDGVQLEPKAVASFSRRTIAENLRTSTPYNVNLLIGGVNSEGRAELYWIDYLGSCVKVPFACHGYAGYFCMGLLDRNYKANMTKEEALGLLKKCIQELKVRFVGNLPSFTVHIYNADGNVEELSF
jgi:20S proteasome subunit beta 4